jgi:hypothetical protein
MLESRANPKKWGELQHAITEYSTSKLDNEVFGIASGSAGRILSQKEAMECCNPEVSEFDTCWAMDSRGIVAIAVGVDWSLVGSKVSHTTITVAGFDSTGKLYVMYAKRIDEKDVQKQVREVIDIYRRFNAQIICSDRGVGVMQGQLISQIIGSDKAYMIQLGAAKVPLTLDRAGGYMFADRTMAMDSVIFKAKLGRSKLETPSWNLMSSPFWSDWLNCYDEETRSGRKVYRKNDGTTDDLLMSTAFANIGFQIMQGDFTYLDQQDPHQLGDF